MRQHNDPNCTCPFPTACGLTPRWFDRFDLSLLEARVLPALATVWFIYESWHHYGWLGIGFVLALTAAIFTFVWFQAWKFSRKYHRQRRNSEAT